MVFSLHCTSNGYQKQTNKQQQQQNWLKTKQSKLAKKQNMEGLGTWEGKTITGAKWQQVVKQSSASAPCSSPLLSAFLFLFFSCPILPTQAGRYLQSQPTTATFSKTDDPHFLISYCGVFLHNSFVDNIG